MADKSLPRSQRRCSCIIPVLPTSFPFPQMSGLFFLPLLSSKRLRRLYFCKSLSRGQQSEMPAFASVASPQLAVRLLVLFYFHTFTSSAAFSLIGDLI